MRRGDGAEVDSGVVSGVGCVELAWLWGEETGPKSTPAWEAAWALLSDLGVAHTSAAAWAVAWAVAWAAARTLATMAALGLRWRCPVGSWLVGVVGTPLLGLWLAPPRAAAWGQHTATHWAWATARKLVAPTAVV
jgi:hypothetical protein